MYVKTRISSLGFQWYRSLRGTSALEGYHQHLFRIIDVRGRSASLRYKCALIAYFNYRWNVKSWVKAGTMMKIGHSFLWLRDLLCDIVASTPGLAGKVPAADGWHRLDTSRTPTVPNGLVHSQRRPMMFGDDGSGAGGGGGSGAGGGGGSAGSSSSRKAAALAKIKPHGQDRSHLWVEAMTSSSMQADLSRTDALMGILPTIAENLSATPEQVHASTGLVTTASGIEAAVDLVSTSVDVQAQLGSAGYSALRGRLRQPAHVAGEPALMLVAPAGSNPLAGPLLMPGLGRVSVGNHRGSHSSVAAAASATASATAAASAVTSAAASAAAVASAGIAGGVHVGGMSPDSKKKAEQASRQARSRAKRKAELNEGGLKQWRADAAAERKRHRKMQRRQKEGAAKDGVESGKGGKNGRGGKGGKGGKGKGGKAAS